jgi:hypothetical protein
MGVMSGMPGRQFEILPAHKIILETANQLMKKRPDPLLPDKPTKLINRDDFHHSPLESIDSDNESVSKIIDQPNKAYTGLLSGQQK